MIKIFKLSRLVRSNENMCQTKKVHNSHRSSHSSNRKDLKTIRRASNSKHNKRASKQRKIKMKITVSYRIQELYLEARLAK